MNNLHSFLLLLVPWALLFVPRTWWSSAATACLVAAIVLSETQSFIFAPLLLLGIRARRKWPIVGAFVVASIAQVATYIWFPRQPIDYGSTTPVTVRDVAVGYLTVPLMTVWTTRLDAVATFVSSHGVTPFLALAAVCIGAAASGIVVGSAPHRWLIPATVLGSVTVWAAALLVTPSDSFAFSHGLARHVATFGTIRYATVTSGLLLISLVVVADALWGSGWVRRGLAVSLAVVLVVPMVVNYHDGGPAQRSEGPTVESQLPAARDQCATDRTATVQLKQSPDRPPWTVTLSCVYVER